MSLDEIRLHLPETGKGISEIELQDLFNKADTNRDGKIDVAEFTKLVELLELYSELESCFEETDTNKDGKIDVTEFSNLVNKLKEAGKLRDMPR